MGQLYLIDFEIEKNENDFYVIKHYSYVSGPEDVFQRNRIDGLECLMHVEEVNSNTRKRYK